MAMSPEYSRTGAIAVNDPDLTLEDRRKLREELIAAETYEKLGTWAKERYDLAYVLYLRKFNSAIT